MRFYKDGARISPGEITMADLERKRLFVDKGVGSDEWPEHLRINTGELIQEISGLLWLDKKTGIPLWIYAAGAAMVILAGWAMT